MGIFTERNTLKVLVCGAALLVSASGYAWRSVTVYHGNHYNHRVYNHNTVRVVNPAVVRAVPFCRKVCGGGRCWRSCI